MASGGETTGHLGNKYRAMPAFVGIHPMVAPRPRNPGPWTNVPSSRTVLLRFRSRLQIIGPGIGDLGTVTMKDSQLPNRRTINAAPSAPTFSAFGANELRCPSLDSPTKEFL